MSDQKLNGITVVGVLLAVVFTTQVFQYISNSSKSLSRQKRLIYLTSERRLSLPPKTHLFVLNTLNVPFRSLPTGYVAGMLITLKFDISFDDIGLTSEENPWGIWPYFDVLTVKRDTSSVSSPVINWSDGDRKVLYQVIEDTLQNMGIDGVPCLQRAICEFFQNPLNNHGFFGEIIELLFSPSRSPQAKIRLKEYITAEKIGRTTGDCDYYYRHCSHSLFTNSTEHQVSGHHSRQKRVVYLTPERRLTFPPNTEFSVTPKLTLPAVRKLPTGYKAALNFFLILRVLLDNLGLTSEENPFGDLTLPDQLFRKKREAGVPVPGINWAGGDREMMYKVVENTLSNIGMNGKACLLRAICEMFQSPLDSHGVIGEGLELFFSASKSPFAEIRLQEYVAAEKKGRTSGDCSRYHYSCSHSLFKNQIYQSSQNTDYDDDSVKAMIDTRRRDNIL